MAKKKNTFESIVYISLFTLFCFTTAIYSTLSIINWKKDVNANDKIQDNITISEIINDNKEVEYNVDFKSLKEKNKDTIAYLKLNNTAITYVVVKTNNNSYYLSHNFEKESNVAGWIFADYHNKFDENDKNIIIYGHNIKDGSMFGTLKKILNKDWYENEDNHKVVLVTENETYYYQVFSTYTTKPEDYYINTNFDNNNDFDNFVKNLKSRSIYDYGIEVTGEDRILTLSSCTDDGNNRIVLHAKLINAINEL